MAFSGNPTKEQILDTIASMRIATLLTSPLVSRCQKAFAGAVRPGCQSRLEDAMKTGTVDVIVRNHKISGIHGYLWCYQILNVVGP